MFLCHCLGDCETTYLLDLQLTLQIFSRRRKSVKYKRWGRLISTILMLLASPTSFNHASSPFSCHNHSLHIVRIILLVTECQKGSKLHCFSISDSHILQIYIGYEDNHLWLWASRSTVYGEFLQNTDDKTLQHLYHWLHSEHCLVPQLSEPCIIPSHNHPITARSLSIWRVRQLFKWENVSWYWITALFLHMHAFSTVNLPLLCLSLWEVKLRHLHLEDSSVLPRQLAKFEMQQVIPQRDLKG